MNFGLEELCTNMEGRLGSKSVIKFLHRSFMLFSIFVMLINVSFMSGL